MKYKLSSYDGINLRVEKGHDCTIDGYYFNNKGLLFYPQTNTHDRFDLSPEMENTDI